MKWLIITLLLILVFSNYTSAVEFSRHGFTIMSKTGINWLASEKAGGLMVNGVDFGYCSGHFYLGGGLEYNTDFESSLFCLKLDPRFYFLPKSRLTPHAYLELGICRGNGEGLEGLEGLSIGGGGGIDVRFKRILGLYTEFGYQLLHERGSGGPFEGRLNWIGGLVFHL